MRASHDLPNVKFFNVLVLESIKVMKIFTTDTIKLKYYSICNDNC